MAGPFRLFWSFMGILHVSRFKNGGAFISLIIHLINRFKIALLLCLSCCRAIGQDISFTNINTTDGLSDNFIRSLAVDKNGFLWIGTNEGLNSYDGYAVTNYSREENPQIPSKTITHLLCDSKNNIWMGSDEGAAWADEKRQFHKIVLDDSIKNFICPFIFETRSCGIILFTNHGHYQLDPVTNKWRSIGWIPGTLGFDHFGDINPGGRDQAIYATETGVYIADFNKKKIIFEYRLPWASSACRLDDSTIAVATQNNNVYEISQPSGKIIRHLQMSIYAGNTQTRNSWVDLRAGPGATLLFGSKEFGFFIIEQNGHVTHYTHDPVDPYSVASDRVSRVISTAGGDVIVGTERSGLSIINLNRKVAFYRKVFSNGKGELFDSWLTEMTEDKDSTFWIGSADRLIHWDRKNNKTEFYYYYGRDKDLLYGQLEIYRLCLDHRGQLWAGISGSGPALFNKNKGDFTIIPRDLSDSTQLDPGVFCFLETNDGKMWVCSRSGFYYIDMKTKKPHSFLKDSLLRPYCTTWTESFTEDKDHNVWIATRGKGLLCYNPAHRTLRQFTQKDGLIDDVCLQLMCSSSNEIYVCNFRGFNVVHPDGSISTYTKENGLRFDKADAFLEDETGRIWIANAKCLAVFAPQTKKIEIFDEHVNLNNGGFKPASSLRTSSGEFLWGTQSGINYFSPSQLVNSTDPVQLSLRTVLAGDSSFSINGNPAKIAYKKNSLEFNFVAVNLKGSHGIHYRYKLEGYDLDWQEVTDIRQARYHFLPPGDYTFKVKASTDRIHWTDAVNQFRFEINAPVFMRWWFRAMAVLVIFGSLLYFYFRRIRQLKQKKEELETEQAINYFASSMYEQQAVDEILWDVAKNCIGRLQFEDCVVYLLDEKKNVLVQKAAYGPKSPRSLEIIKPIDIPIGKGVVGSVALHKKAEIIPDTTKDDRYIADDAVRLSEITVPIISNDKVLGIIDCEHSKKRFFTQKHLSILTTIASLCANKIIRARTEVEKKQTEMMLAETKNKMAEAEMQALRAQMNPHFIFNCLNSINRYIVKSDQATASLYLTRFAKLIRLILDNSHSKNVVLSNELEALRLYIEMESLRFDSKFSYEITVDKDVPVDSIEVPPLIIQPYIENAIWHGLLHKTDPGSLQIHLNLLSPSMLQCIIQDNGVGREKAAELKSKTATRKKSLGMELTENRLLLLNQYASVHSSVEIEDLKNGEGEASGTRVILKIPIGDN